MDKKFIVIGANGQDGSHISSLIIKSKNKVYGIGKQKNSKYFKNSKFFKYIKQNLKDSNKFNAILKKIKPDYIINFAALHGSSEEKWNNNLKKSIEVNTMPTNIILDYICKYNLKCFYFYASSMRCLKLGNKINESSKRVNTDYYQISKNLSETLINNYRKKFKIKSSIGWFFQHESILRKKTFFVPKIINILRKSIKNKKYNETVNHLDFCCDWGSAKEFMQIVLKILKRKINKDFIIGTGKTYTGREMVKIFFNQYNLDYKKHIKESSKNNSFLRYNADISLLKRKLKFYPKKDIFKVLSDIMKFIHYKKRKNNNLYNTYFN